MSSIDRTVYSYGVECHAAHASASSRLSLPNPLLLSGRRRRSRHSHNHRVSLRATAGSPWTAPGGETDLRSVTAPGKESSGVGSVVSVGLAVIAVTYGLGRFTFGLLVPEMAADLSMDDAAIGFAGAGSYAGYLAALIAAPFLVARLDTRRVVAIAAAATASGLAMVAATPNAGFLTFGVTVAGTGSGLSSPALAEMVERLLHRRHRAPAQSWINAGTSIGILAGVGVALVTVGSWRVSWMALAVVALVAAALPGRLAPSPAQGRIESGRIENWKGLALASLALGGASSVMWAFGREAVLRSGALSASDSLIMWSMIGLGGLAGGMVGWLSDRFGLPTASRLGWAIMALALSAMAVAPGSKVAAIAAACGFGAAYMALTGALLLWGVRVGIDRPSAGVRTAFLTLAVGQLVATPLAGLAAEAWGLPVAFALAAATAVAGATPTPLGPR